MVARHGGKFVAEKAHLDSWVTSEEDKAESEALADDLERLGPTFVKLGQLLSTRADFLSEDYLKALERLQDQVEKVPFEDVMERIREELDAPVDSIYAHIEPEPLAAASLGQVHRARLHNGQEVIIKVQRPHIEERVERELKVLAEVSEAMEKHSKRAQRYRLVEIVEELSRSLKRELDYRMEEKNLSKMAEQLEESELIFVPRSYPQYTSKGVLTMDFVDGTKLPTEGAAKLGSVNGILLADELFRVYLTQVLYEGTYHADPHPGNVLITPEGRLCLLDLGMVGNMPGSLQIILARLLIAIAEEDGDAAAETALDASGRAEDADESKFRREIGDLLASYHRQPLGEMQAGRLILQITESAGENGILIPYELTMLAKTLMNLDQIGARLDPHFDPSAALRRHTAPILQKRLTRDFTPKLLLDGYLETRTLVKDGPRLANNILRDLERGTFKVRVDAVDERELLVSFQKIANRIGMSLIIGALILGASLMMSADVSGPRLLGFPLFSMICFLLAAGGGVSMIWSIYRQDRRSGKELNQPLQANR